MARHLPWLLALLIGTKLCALTPTPAPVLPPAPAASGAADTEEMELSAKCASLLAGWHSPGSKHDDASRAALISAAVAAEKPEVLEEVAAGGDVAAMEIKLPADARQVVAASLLDLGEIPESSYRSSLVDCVIRRMTKDRFEAWTAKHGWLFDSKGGLVNEAAPPRRDGEGREWHGAFLPDGRWVTTDLWEMDKTLYFFSPAGRQVREIKAAKLAPAKKDDLWTQSLIGWARCDRRGEGWVVSVGDGPGRARLFVKPDGKARLLAAPDKARAFHAPPANYDMDMDPLPDELWKLCYPRDLEPKGFFIALYRPSDDFKTGIERQSPAHGMWVESPGYGWQNGGAIIPGGESEFGFLPGSHDVFIGATSYIYREGADQPESVKSKTWFFASGGKCRGWVRGSYLTDAAEGRGISVRDEQNCVATLGADLKPQARERFVIGGVNATPVKIFTDLKLGFFLAGKRLVLARW